MQKFINSSLQCNGINNQSAVVKITELFINALKGMYFATGKNTICDCEIPKPYDPYDENLGHVCKDCNCIIIEK